MPTCNSIRLKLENNIALMLKSLCLDKTCFERFFQHEDIVGLLERFIIYHVDAPGQVRVNSLVFTGLVIDYLVSATLSQFAKNLAFQKCFVDISFSEVCLLLGDT